MTAKRSDSSGRPSDPARRAARARPYLTGELRVAFDAWLDAAVERHSRELEFREIRKGVQALSALYVQRRAGADLAARAEGIGSNLTGMLQSFYASEVFDILGAPQDAGWYLHGVVAMGYPTGRWGVGARKPVHEVAARNRWEGDLGFNVTEPLWPR